MKKSLVGGVAAVVVATFGLAWGAKFDHTIEIVKPSSLAGETITYERFPVSRSGRPRKNPDLKVTVGPDFVRFEQGRYGQLYLIRAVRASDGQELMAAWNVGIKGYDSLPLEIGNPTNPGPQQLVAKTVPAATVPISRGSRAVRTHSFEVSSPTGEPVDVTSVRFNFDTVNEDGHRVRIANVRVNLDDAQFGSVVEGVDGEQTLTFSDASASVRLNVPGVIDVIQDILEDSDAGIYKDILELVGIDAKDIKGNPVVLTTRVSGKILAVCD